MWLTLLSLTVCLVFTRYYLPFQEHRRDTTQLNDVILNLCPMQNVSHFIAILIVVIPTVHIVEIICHSFLSNSNIYSNLEKFLFKFAMCNCIKTLTLFLTPLSVPKNHIPLCDHISAFLVNQKSAFQKDLFFSGHTALLCLCFFQSHHIFSAVLYSLSILCMALLLMINRAHYTIDIVMAPFIVFCCHHFTEIYIY